MVPYLHQCPSPTCRKKFQSYKLLRQHVTRKHGNRLSLQQGGIPTRADLEAMPRITRHRTAPPVPASPPLRPPPQPPTSSPDRPSFQTEHPSQPAGSAYSRYLTPFEVLRAKQRLSAQPPWHPFRSQPEWEFAQWILKSGITQRDTDKLLKSQMFRELRGLSNDYGTFYDNRTFLKTIDSLPNLGQAKWKLTEISFNGTVIGPDGKPLSETLELWMRDPVECVQELIGNPAFQEVIEYAPVRETEVVDADTDDEVMEDEAEENPDQFFEEMWSGDWWWEVQEALGAHATVAPVILASDKTQLSTFSGDKQAWPVYLSIGNIKKSVRRRPSQRATVLFGYLPVSKLQCFHPHERSNQGHRLFHFAMRQLLQPLATAGLKGIMMTCADGQIRHVFPILASYIADYPEQCLVTCCRENRCPRCKVPPGNRGQRLASLLNHLDQNTGSILRDPEKSLGIIRDRVAQAEQYEAQGLRDVPQPFWDGLPYVNIYRCMTPDMLHQLHKGVFKDHLFKWCTSQRKDEVDARFMRLPPFNGLRHFAKGVSTISQWTGSEHREMEKVFVGVVMGLHDEDSEIVEASRHLLDFIYLSHYPSHSTSTLRQMREALDGFHEKKDVFVRIGERNHFNISKLHSLEHYISSIVDFGGLDGVNSEISERLHIDFAKLGYRASNRKAYLVQMVIWLTRREKANAFASYQVWVDASAGRSGVESYLSPAKYDDETSRFEVTEGVEAEDTVEYNVAEGLEGIGTGEQPSLSVNSNPQAKPNDEISNYGCLDVAVVEESQSSEIEMENEDDPNDDIFGPYQVSKTPGVGVWNAETISSQMGATDFRAELQAGSASCPVPRRLPHHAGSSIIHRESPIGVSFDDVNKGLADLAQINGKPRKLTYKAKGLQWANWAMPSRFPARRPFDRHDWIVRRETGELIRYVIDYYTNELDEEGNPAFILDVRPASDSLSSVQLKCRTAIGGVWGSFFGSESTSKDVST